MFFYTYVLLSERDKNQYIGYTSNLKRRLKEHADGKNIYTKPRGPLRLIYAEICCDERDAKQREKYLKSTIGRRFLSRRLYHFRHS